MSKKTNKEFKYPKDDSNEISTEKYFNPKIKTRKKKSKSIKNNKTKSKNASKNQNNNFNNKINKKVNLIVKESKEKVSDESDYELNEKGILIKNKPIKENKFQTESKLNKIKINSKRDEEEEISSNEFDLYYEEFKNFKCINNNNVIFNEDDNNITTNCLNKKEFETKIILNAKDENLSISDECENLLKSSKEKNNFSNNFDNSENANSDIHHNLTKEKIKINKDTIVYENRIFKYNLNANKYKGKNKRKIYYCCNHYHMINKRRELGLSPFCKMKITYYSDKIEEEQFKITGNHSIDCDELFNNKRSDKKKLIDEWEKFKNLCYEEFNKITEYKRKNLIEKAYQILNDNKIQIKNITEGKIINMISEWKKNSQRFKKYVFFEDNKTFDGFDLLQMHIYKKLPYKNKRVFFECFIFGNDFFLQRIRQSKNLFIDANYKHPKDFLQILTL